MPLSCRLPSTGPYKLAISPLGATTDWNLIACTRESTRDQLKIVAGKMKAREAVHYAITDRLGGLQSCVGLGRVPRKRQQVKDMARRKAVT